MGDESFRNFQNRDEDYFNWIFSAYWKRIEAFCYSKIHDHHIAENLANEIFEKVWKTQPVHTHQIEFESWLMTVARNHVISEIRKRSKEPQYIELGKLNSNDVSHISKNLAGTIDTLHTREFNEALEYCVQKLPNKQQNCFRLVKIKDLSYREVQEITDSTKEQIGQNIFRANINLRECLSRKGFTSSEVSANEPE